MIVAQIDGRGSGGQGERLRAQLKGRLGSVEIEDQLGVLTYLRDKFRFIDPTRICTYGWGYGGYAGPWCWLKTRNGSCSVRLLSIRSFRLHITVSN